MEQLRDVFHQIFQSTPPRRRRRKRIAEQTEQIDFQSTPPRRRRRHRASTGLCDERVFNPRLREGGDDFGKESLEHGFFSIHASAKEATGSLQSAEHDGKVFNPRLREGGDNEDLVDFIRDLSFQSTPPRRRRPIC